MADPKQVEMLRRSVEEWNAWMLNDPVRLGLIKLDLRGADLIGASLDRANLHGATLNRADLRNASLTHANLGMADLTEADLSEANLAQADLGEANLDHATLNRANLTQANLAGANLRGAYLFEADVLTHQFLDQRKGRGVTDGIVEDRLVQQNGDALMATAAAILPQTGVAFKVAVDGLVEHIDGGAIEYAGDDDVAVGCEVLDACCDICG